MGKVNQISASLHLSNALRNEVVKKALKELPLPLASCGLDAGCGIGLYSLLLAEIVGSGGRIVGLDISKELIEEAYSLAAQSELKDRITFNVGDVTAIPYRDNTFDWACSIDLVGYNPGDPVLLLKELGRIVKPGGLVFILVWSSQMLLPGYPLLEAQLNATSAGIAPFTSTMQPERHFMRAREWFEQAGFKGITAKTLVGDISTPLSPELRDALTDLFRMRWDSCKEEVPPEVWETYTLLCSPDSPKFILNLPNYYAFFTYSLFYGCVDS